MSGGIATRPTTAAATLVAVTLPMEAIAPVVQPNALPRAQVLEAVKDVMQTVRYSTKARHWKPEWTANYKDGARGCNLLS